MKNMFILFFVSAVIFNYDASHAQGYQNSMPCKCKGNPKLKQMILNGKVDGLPEHNVNNSSYEDWSTSILKPDGRPPEIEPEGKDELGQSKIKFDTWSCMYSAYNAMDGDTKTAWSEGVDGDGIGEILVARIDTSRPVKIWAGLGASQDLYKANNRPGLINVYVLQSGKAPGAAQFGTFYSDIKVLAKHTVELKDINGFQPLILPKFQQRKDGGAFFIAIEILSVYPGLKYRDTCISEIKNAE
jgi:hypothetical protein